MIILYILFYFLSFIFYFNLFSFTFVIYFLFPNTNFHLADLSQSAFAFSMTIQMLKTQKRLSIVIHTKEDIGLVRLTMFVVILCCLLVAPIFFVTEAVAPKCSIKKAPQEIPRKPTGKHLHQRIPFNEEETCVGVCF